jgi:hypothetical protein
VREAITPRFQVYKSKISCFEEWSHQELNEKVVERRKGVQYL